MILCNCCTDEQPTPIHWTDCMFVLVATCTVTVAAFLNFGLTLSICVGGVLRKYPITVQLCMCGFIACAALSCHVQQVWDRGKSRSPDPTVCVALGLATLFSHCAFVTLTFMELRFANRKFVVHTLIFISWCVISMVTYAASVNCTPTTSILVFCFYVLHIPLVALVIVNQLHPRSVSPSSEVTLRKPEIRRILPQVLLFFVGTMPQAFMTAVEAFNMKPSQSADAWCSLMTAFFAVLRPLLDATMRPELGKVSVDLIGYLCRRKVLNRSIAE